MTRAYNTATTQQNSGGAVNPFVAGKNCLINADFRINQRAFTSTTTNQAYTFDRWMTGYTGGTVTYSAQAFTPGAAPMAGYEGTNFVRIVTSGQTAGHFAIIEQRVEDVRTFSGNTITVSFWAKATSGTPKIFALARQNFGSGGSADVDAASSQLTLSTSWARYSATIALPSVSGKTIGSGSCLRIQFVVSDGNGSMGAQNNTFDLWGTQLEIGSVATPFQTATGTLQGELAACQRYYWRSNNNGAAYAVIGTAMGVSSTTGRVFIQTPVPLRAGAISIEYSNLLELSFYTPGASVVNGATSITLYGAYSGISMVTVSFIFPSGLTSNAMYVLACNGTTNAYLAISSEL